MNPPCWLPPNPLIVPCEISGIGELECFSNWIYFDMLSAYQTSPGLPIEVEVVFRL